MEKAIKENQQSSLIKDYNKEGITTLRGLSAVRKRPGMYVGSTQSIDGHNSHGLIQIAQEVLSNAIDEAYAGFGREIKMTIYPDNSLSVSDHGRGLPKGKNFDDAIRALTVLHSSGKFDAAAYANPIGQNGVGIKATNALSKWIQIEAVTTNHEHYLLKFAQEKCLEKKNLPYDKSMSTGTTITFLPDDTIFDIINWEDEPLINKMEQAAFLTPKVKFIFEDRRRPAEPNADDESTEDNNDTDADTTDTESQDIAPTPIHEFFYREWYSEHGLSDYVSYLMKDTSPIPGLKHPIAFDGTYHYEHESKAKQHPAKISGDIEVQGGLAYVESTGTDVYAFANGAPTIDGGYHVDGAKTGIYQAFRDFAKDKKLLKNKQSFDSQDSRDGLILTILVKVPENIMQFSSQSKTKLTTADARYAARKVIYDQVTTWLYDHVNIATRIVQNMVDSKRVRDEAIKNKKAARKARKAKSLAPVSPKLKPATSKDPQKKTLFITEGDSASSLLSMVRDKRYQAVFPIRGKILNTESVKLSMALANSEISTIARVIGAGIGKEFDPKEMEYDKIIITSDADDDGAHIASLLITLFYNFFPGLIEGGHLYRVISPLYLTTLKNKAGKTLTEIAYDESEHAAYKQRIQQAEANGYKQVGMEERFKGLGSLTPELTQKYLADPKYRKLLQIKIDDDQAFRHILQIWMGKHADLRKSQIAQSVDFDNLRID